MNQNRLCLRVVHHKSGFVFFQERVHWPCQRTQFPTGKIGDDVLSAVRHQQGDHVAFTDSMRSQQGRCSLHRQGKLGISELPAVGLRKQKYFFRRRLWLAIPVARADYLQFLPG